MAPPKTWLPPFMRETYRSTNKWTFDPEWPDGARCCVSLHVHVDGQINDYWRDRYSPARSSAA